MDVDITTKSPDSEPVVPATVCLPFSKVPGMDVSSKSYHKAMATLAKQQGPTVAPKEPRAMRSILDKGLSAPIV